MSRFCQPSYTGSIQLKTNKFIVRSDELAMAENVTNDVLGAWGTRSGITQLGNTLQSGKNVTGIFDDKTTGGKYLAVVGNSDDTYSVLKWLNTATWTSVGGATTLPLDINPNFVSYLDVTQVMGVNSSGEFMSTGTLDDTTYTSEATYPKAAYGVVFFDQLYLFDCEVSGVRYRNRAYYSSIPAYSGGWSFSFTTATDYLQFNTDDGDYLTGAVKSYGQMMVFKRYSLFVVDSNQNIVQVDGTGCTSPKSIVSDDDKNVYYSHFSNKKKGIYRWDGTGAKKISRAIDVIINGSSGTGVIGGLHEDHVYQFIGDVTIDENSAEYYGLDRTMSNVLLDYSILDDFWIVHTLPVAVTSIGSYGNDMYLGDENGKVYKWGAGSSDDNTNIQAKIITHNFYGTTAAEYNLYKTFNQIIINMHRQNEAQAFYSVDNGDWKPLGELKHKVNVLSVSEKGYGIKIKVTGNHGSFIFEGIEIDYTNGDAIKTS